jgi:hypothetical protein
MPIRPMPIAHQMQLIHRHLLSLYDFVCAQKQITHRQPEILVDLHGTHSVCASVTYTRVRNCHFRWSQMLGWHSRDQA